MIKQMVCGVLLYEQAYEDIGDALKPYIKEAAIGKYIYCNSANQNGAFLDMLFKPEMCNGSVKDEMLISIPIKTVKFIASGNKSLPIGFTTQI